MDRQTAASAIKIRPMDILRIQDRLGVICELSSVTAPKTKAETLYDCVPPSTGGGDEDPMGACGSKDEDARDVPSPTRNSSSMLEPSVSWMPAFVKKPQRAMPRRSRGGGDGARRGTTQIELMSPIKLMRRPLK